MRNGCENPGCIVGEGLCVPCRYAPSRRKETRWQKNVRRFRRLCEFAEHLFRIWSDSAGASRAPSPTSRPRFSCFSCFAARPFLIVFRRASPAHRDPPAGGADAWRRAQSRRAGPGRPPWAAVPALCPAAGPSPGFPPASDSPGRTRDTGCRSRPRPPRAGSRPSGGFRGGSSASGRTRLQPPPWCR